MTATLFSTHHRTTAVSKPGETINCAPASIDSLHFSRVSTVPAPTNISGTADLTFLIAWIPAAVRMVISITSNPASSNAWAAGTASSALSITTTGTRPASPIRSSTSISTSFNVLESTVSFLSFNSRHSLFNSFASAFFAAYLSQNHGDSFLFDFARENYYAVNITKHQVAGFD